MDLPSKFIVWWQLQIISGLEYQAYDSFIDSCCFIHKYKDLEQCLYCKELRFNWHGKPRCVIQYSPLIPQLCVMFQHRLFAWRLYYCVQAEQAYKPGTTQDVFNSEDHHFSCRTQVSPDSDDLYCYFGNPQDLTLGLSTDGFMLFKHCRHSKSMAWLIESMNYNLHLLYPTHLENVICVGVIPRPQQCKEIPSFLVPPVDELQELDQGITTLGFSEHVEEIHFVFVAFSIIVFGDIMAITKLLFMKGQNGIFTLSSLLHWMSPLWFTWRECLLCVAYASQQGAGVGLLQPSEADTQCIQGCHKHTRHP